MNSVSTPRGLALALALAAAAAAAQNAPHADLAGSWTGSARLRAEAPAGCAYVTPPEGDGVTLRLTQTEEGLRGTLILDVPASGGPSCPPLPREQEITHVTVSGSSVSFRDPSGHEWNLGLRAGALQGLVAWKTGADTAAGDGGPRVSGEVRFARATTAAGRPAEAAVSSGSGMRGVIGIVGANVVAAGAFVLTNRLIDDSGQQDEGGGPAATCSPRVCFFVELTDPCTCTIDVVTGGSCFTTPGGALAGAPCNGSSVPCQSGLSCNNGICEDEGGRCPF